MATKTVTDASFQSDVLQSDKPVLVDFWAEWCGPCKMIGPALEEISEELADKVTLAKINIDENPDAPGQYGVRGIPTMILFKNGQPAATKVGAVVVNTMPMLRAGELAKIVDKAEIGLALCDTRSLDEMAACAKDSRFLEKVVGFDGTANHDAELDRVALSKPVRFEAADTSQDDVALLGFTSGTTGEPKATMHFHRDILLIADTYAKEVLSVTPEDVFVGSPPLAFTFGLGGLAVFPLRFGASAVLLEAATPPNIKP